MFDLCSERGIREFEGIWGTGDSGILGQTTNYYADGKIVTV
jgi:hypothetical protein